MDIINNLQALRIEMSERNEIDIVEKIDELVALLTLYMK